MLFENCSKDKISDRLKSVAFIIFNYDRCFEHFIAVALANYYKLTAQEITDITNEIEIYHPYGVVGDFFPLDGGASFVNFGEEPVPGKLLQIAKNIKTFTEGTNTASSDIIALREAVLNAGRIIFLGFAFHTLNMDLLVPTAPKDSSLRNIPFFGTVKNVSEYNSKLIKNEIEQRFKNVNILPQFNFINSKCSDFFNEYWRGLSFT